MSSFDPFLSTEYKKNLKDDNFNDPEPKLSKKTDSEFLSEILCSCFSGTSKQLTQNTQIEHIVQKQIEQEKSEQNSIVNSSSSGTSKKSYKNSPFHNFQKHLVITLRQILSLKALRQKAGQQYEVAIKIFQHFKNSTKTSRIFLEGVFGLFQARGSSQNAGFDEGLLKSQLQYVLANYQYETIKRAQQILRHFTKIQLDECDICQCLARRKIQKKPQFIEYINLFKTELVQGKQRKKTYKTLAKKFQNL